MDYLVVVTISDNRLGDISRTENQTKVLTAAAIILKRMWEAHCDVVFNIPIDMTRITSLTQLDLIMEMS